MKLWAALLACVALIASPAYADKDPWADLDVMDAAELSSNRGGIAIAPGIEVGFGAVVTTMVNGMPALQTQLTWTNTGAIVSQTITSAGQELSTLTPAQRDALGLGGLDSAGGMIINDANGVTALVHNVTEGSLQNIILNNAGGRDITQHIDVTLELPGFEAMQGLLSLERFGMRIDSDMNLAFTTPR
jgi:hypothetical protein